MEEINLKNLSVIPALSRNPDSRNLDSRLRGNDRIINMQPPQPTTPQKTSFWDFWHKKIYTDRKEKIIDLIAGFILGLAFNPFTIFWIMLFFVLHQMLPNIPLGKETFLIFLIPGLAMCIYAFLKRKYIFPSLFINYLIGVLTYFAVVGVVGF
ncbi:MAG: hypothetical protein LiPW39_179 [Parcubacteria group bacterium LiPW_39]|nr:MAG: hypothetical protein LiPW39_179 [Parcubacteria group bacterium LiPW_39]